jgi:hypothetical protein
MQPAYVGTSDVVGVDYYPIGYLGQNAAFERVSAATAVGARRGRGRRPADLDGRPDDGLDGLQPAGVQAG